MEIIVSDDANLDNYAADERVIRLYQYWLGKRGERSLPSRYDIDPVDFSFALGMVSLVDIKDDPRRFHYCLVSTTLTDRLGYEMTGKYVDEIPDEDARRYVKDLYTRAADLRKPIYEKSSRIYDNRKWEHEALVLPLSSDGVTVDMLLIYRITQKPEPLPRYAQV